MKKLISTNPSQNFSKIGGVKVSSSKEISDKVKKAGVMTQKWANTYLKERVTILKNVYKALFKRKDEISKLASTEMGFPIKEQKMFDMGDGFYYFKWYLDNAIKLLSPEVTFQNNKEAHKIYYEPYGVAAVIQPWNFPFCQWSWSVVPNLVAGNTVVFKHSEECPLTGKLLEEIINKTDLPKGVFNEVYGDGKVGEALLEQEIDLICFTGSAKVGKKIYKIASKKFVKVLLELGGSAPGIVFPDADLEESIEHIFAVRFTNNGQACDGLKRLIVHPKISNDVVELLKRTLEEKKIGNPLDENTDFGPLVAKRQQRLVASQVRDAIKKGAKVITVGKIPRKLKGAYFQPTILTNIKRNMRVWKEEVFGPVLPIIPFKSEKEAVELANDTEYGLGGYVYTKDLEKAQRVSSKLKTGMVSINGTNYVHPFNPFGGYNMSGIGREHGKHGLQELTQIKVISSEK